MLENTAIALPLLEPVDSICVSLGLSKPAVPCPHCENCYVDLKNHLKKCKRAPGNQQQSGSTNGTGTADADPAYTSRPASTKRSNHQVKID